MRVLYPVVLLALFGFLLLIVSLIARPLMPPSALPRVKAVSDLGNMEPVLTDYQLRKLGHAQQKDRQQLREYAARAVRARRDRERLATEFLRRVKTRQVERAVRTPVSTRQSAAAPAAPKPVVAGFYVNWEETSRASTHRNIASLTHFIPEWLHLKPHGANYADRSPFDNPFVDAREVALDKQDITPFVRSHGVSIVVLLNNYTKPIGAEEGVGSWDMIAVHQVVSNPSARANVIDHIRDWLLKEQMQGINIDFEEVAAEDKAGLVEFMRELYQALHPRGLLVTEDIELDADGLDVPALARWNDWIVPMVYDEHAGGTQAGPVAGIEWTRQELSTLLARIPPSKVVMGVGNHGYDWTVGSTSPQDLTYQSAVITAKESQPDAVIHLDPTSLNPTFDYWDTATDGSDKEQQHVVWMQDAATVYDQLTIGKHDGIRGAALWFLGAEDPSLWSFYNKGSWSADWTRIVSAGALRTITYGGQAEVDFEGDGELLQPVVPPSPGFRTVKLDPNTGLITAEAYDRDPETGDFLLPSAYVVRRYGGTTGNVKKQIVLSFDDGPDPTWTPQILRILERYHVPAVFFDVGKQAEENPGIVRREWDDGDLIGNHSWSHPDLFRLPLAVQRLQLTTTQRVIQAITGHSTLLFRPPYGGDTEPQTGREVEPLEVAASLGYLTVGETNDPQDWRLCEFKPGTEAQDLAHPRNWEEIAKSVIVNRSVGSVVLLHDAGGDRSMTVRALPEIISQLRALGYTFIDVAQLRGVSRDRLMPPVSGRDMLLAGADEYVFEVTYWFQRTLSALFVLSLLLGFSRVAIFIVLALIQRYRERRRVFAPGFQPTVSVVIAAYNEERVIARTVRAILECSYPGLEVIVVDDGSQDRTSDVIASEFADDARVHLIQKPNGGKASALNRGIAVATGEILISLDADTLFAPDTIQRLVRHFADSAVGAVSGNVRVGNANNLLTRWQSIEYITSQNFDRRGYDLLNCITVVPGAVGALRRSAVLAVGGYTEDTLAEDTDLTWKLRRAGWRINNDTTAYAYTEAPETLVNLARQRFRWAFGTLQCLWKHRGALGQDGAFGAIALPSLWLYQILFPAVSPFMDIAVVYALVVGNFAQVALMYLAIFAAELVAATIAIVMDRGDLTLLPWLFLQRFVYRQLMYYVILKSIVSAVRGHAVGWNKFERTGTARIETRA